MVPCLRAILLLLQYWKRSRFDGKSCEWDVEVCSQENAVSLHGCDRVKPVKWNMHNLDHQTTNTSLPSQGNKVIAFAHNSFVTAEHFYPNFDAGENMSWIPLSKYRSDGSHASFRLQCYRICMHVSCLLQPLYALELFSTSIKLGSPTWNS